MRFDIFLRVFGVFRVFGAGKQVLSSLPEGKESGEKEEQDQEFFHFRNQFTKRRGQK